MAGRVIARFKDQRDKCKHGRILSESCSKCWTEGWCRQCHKKIEGLAWWAPTYGPQCLECRAKVPTAAEAISKLKSVIEGLSKIADKLDAAPPRKTKKPKFKMPQREG